MTLLYRIRKKLYIYYFILFMENLNLLKNYKVIKDFMKF